MAREARPMRDTGQSSKVRKTDFPSGQNHRLWIWANGVQILILSLTSGMTLGKLLTLSALNAVTEVVVPDSMVLTVQPERQMLRKGLPALYGASDMPI